MLFSTEFRDGGTRGDREPVRRAACGGGAGEAGGDGDPGGRGEAGAEAGGGDPGPPGAAVHRAEEDAGSGGKAVQKQKWRGFFTGEWKNMQNIKHLRSIGGKDAASLLMSSRVSLFPFCRNIRSGRKKPLTFPCPGSTLAWWTASTPSAASSSTPRRRCAPRSSLPTWKRSKRRARTVRRMDVAGRRSRRCACQLCVGRVHTRQECSAVWVVAWPRQCLNTLPVGFLAHLCVQQRQVEGQTSLLFPHHRTSWELTLMSATVMHYRVLLCLFLQTKWE